MCLISYYFEYLAYLVPENLIECCNLFEEIKMKKYEKHVTTLHIGLICHTIND